MKQNEHLFQFQAHKIAQAAGAERDYHQERLNHWTKEQTALVEQAKGLTAVVKVQEQAITGGKVFVIVADITGVQEINWKLHTCGQKIEIHRKAAEEFAQKAAAYGTQDRVYDLDPSDVAYFRLAGAPRAE